MSSESIPSPVQSIEALPLGSGVLDAHGLLWQCQSQGVWYPADARLARTTADLVEQFGPLRVVFRPDRPFGQTQSDGDRDALNERGRTQFVAVEARHADGTPLGVERSASAPIATPEGCAEPVGRHGDADAPTTSGGVFDEMENR